MLVVSAVKVHHCMMCCIVIYYNLANLVAVDICFKECGFSVDLYCPVCHDLHTFNSTGGQQACTAAFTAGMTYTELQKFLAALDIQPPSNSSFYKRQEIVSTVIKELLNEEMEHTRSLLKVKY